MNIDKISPSLTLTRQGAVSGSNVHVDGLSRKPLNTPPPVSDNSQIKDDRSTSELSVQDAVKRLSEFVSQTSSEINFSIDEESGTNIVKIMDSKTNQVIRQFPSEEAIAIAHALDKLQGLLIKDKA